MRVSLIVAVSENGIIGRDGGLPWTLSNDLRYFKSVTMGKPIVMGRKTYDSIGRPLPGRPNLVVTRNPDFAGDGIEIFHSLADAVDGARSHGADEAMIIGGAALYEEALQIADRIYLTEVHADVAGDVSFPAGFSENWTETSRERHQAGDRDDYDHSFVVLDRVTTV
ncbi:MAG: dihydrofolate reductase [Alphaproteobacteria bacterium]